MKTGFIICLFLLFISISSTVAQVNRVTVETELAGVKLGITKDKVVEILGEPEEEILVIGPRTGLVYDFMNYPSKGILVVLGDARVSLVTISSPCEAKTAKGLALGDELSKAKELYGKGIKESLGEVSKFSFPEYNVSVKGKKGTVIISEITRGDIKIY